MLRKPRFITALVSCAQPLLPDDLWITDDKSIEWPPLLSGIWSIIDAGGNNLKHGIFLPTLQNCWHRDRTWAAQSPGDWVHLVDLRYLLEESLTDTRVSATLSECY
jgi:hypothetical protein